MAVDVAVILAAGKGTRMQSERAKVLHLFRGRPLVAHPVEAALDAGARTVVVVTGHQGEAVERAVRQEAARIGRPDAVRFAHQARQRGTGHAVLCALPEVPADNAWVWVLNGDTPMVRSATVARLRVAAEASTAGLVMTTLRPGDPSGYGRLVRGSGGHPAYIREDRDCTEAERASPECNAGMYCVRAEHLHADLPRLGADNAQGEIYLTDLVERRACAGTVAVVELDAIEAAGVNTPDQLAALEAAARDRDRALR